MSLINHIPRILSLDGGGVRGLSSLVILREIMQNIEHETGATETPRPSEYFDLMGGTSTGGLIAIMLGLLGMVPNILSPIQANQQTVNECINAYLKLSKEIFKIDQVVLGKIPVGDDKCRFDHNILETAFKAIIKDRRSSEDCSMSAVSNTSYHVCPTFVVATRAVNADGPPAVFRSYSGKDVGPSECAIWQAARATSAAPSFFKEMSIDNPRPAVKYVDGGLGYNNPSEVALIEAERLWPTSKHFCLVSIGTGRQKAVRIIDTSKLDDDIHMQHSLFQHVKSFIPDIVVPGWKTARNCPPGVLYLFNVVNALSNIVTSSDNVHQRVQRTSRAIDTDKQFPYFRFSVDRDVGDIGFEDWRKEEEIAVHTAAYLNEQEAEEMRSNCVKCLIDPPSFRHITAPGIMQSNYFLVPYEKNQYFVGREDLLGLLFDNLCHVQPHQYNHRIALYGLGGVGKTQIALAYAYSKKDFYASIFWISGIDQAALFSGFRRVAEATGNAAGISEAKPSCVAGRVLAWLEHQPSWLLVIDNLDDVAVVNRFLPTSDTKRHTLLTTRNRNAAGIPARGFEVTVLDHQAAVQLFNIHADIDPLQNSVAGEADKIVETLGYLPLAIEQSGAYLRETSRNINEFLPLYQESRSMREKLHRWIPDGNRNYSYSVGTTWNMSFQIIENQQEYPQAARLLKLFAFLNPDSILLKFLQAGSEAVDGALRKVIHDTLDLDGTLKTLERFSLVKRIRNPASVSMHRLVQEVIQLDMDEAELQYWWEQIAKLCLAAFPTEITSSTRPVCRQYEAQVLVPISKSLLLKSDDLGLILFRVANFLGEDGKFRQAESLQRKALEVMTDLKGPNHPSTLNVKSNLAWIYGIQERWDDAVSLQEAVLKAFEEQLGKHDVHILNARLRLAWMYNELGRNNDAAGLQLAVVEARKTLGEKDPDLLVAMGNLALTYFNQCQWDKAIRLQEKVLAGNIAVLGREHRETLTAMSNLATSYSKSGRFGDALELQEEVVEVRGNELGKQHPDTLIVMANLGMSYINQGRYDDAIHLEKEVCDLAKSVYEDRYSDVVLVAMNNLALAYTYQERWTDAVGLQEIVFKERERILGLSHKETRTAIGNLGFTYESMGELDKASEFYERLREISEQMYGKRHSTTLWIIGLVSGICVEQKQWEKAVGLQEELLKWSRSELGNQHTDTLIAMANLGSTYLELRRPLEGARLLEEAFKGSERVFGPQDPNTVQILANLMCARGIR